MNRPWPAPLRVLFGAAVGILAGSTIYQAFGWWAAVLAAPVVYVVLGAIYMQGYYDGRGREVRLKAPRPGDPEAN